MGKRKMESFVEAKSKLSAFLKDKGRSGEIIWIFREEIARIGGLAFYRIHNRNKNEKLASQVYELGLQKGFGITVASQFYSDLYTAAYVWVPKNEIEAMEHLQGRCLKLLVLEKGADPKRFKDVEIKNQVLWKIIKLLDQTQNKFNGYIDTIPLKANIGKPNIRN
jgi:hypothetical protein